MNHYTAYRAEAVRCRQKAEQEPVRRGYWLREAEKWQKRADEDPDGRAPFYEIKRSRMVPKLD
jgi:hypothetical protein